VLATHTYGWDQTGWSVAFKGGDLNRDGQSDLIPHNTETGG
jgi:hypothetical protein